MKNMRLFSWKYSGSFQNLKNLIWKMKGLLDETQNCFVGNDASQTIVFVASSIVNLNELFQSAVLLLEKGLPIPAKILMRTILELSLKIIEALSNDQYIEELIYAFYSEKKTLAIKDAKDCICGEFVMCYPPGIPILAPGERITQDILDYIEYARIKGCSLTGPEDPEIKNINILEEK